MPMAPARQQASSTADHFPDAPSLAPPAGMVEEVLPRSTRLSEPAVANVDHVLLVFSAALPAFQPAPATRYLLSAEAAWLPVRSRKRGAVVCRRGC